MGGSRSKPAPVLDHLFPENWRMINFDVSRKTQMIELVRNLKIRHPGVEHLRVLVLGPIGASKSTLINSIESIFQGRICQRALADTISNESFTQKFQTQKIRDGENGKFLPFVISDVMGLEDAAGGAHVNEITMILKGHAKDGYCFNPTAPQKDTNYHRRPTLNNKVHCLVFVLPADKIVMMGDDNDGVITKMRNIRKEATALRIPQVVFMTMVDKACPEVNKDLKMIYRSKKIKEKMQECSNKLGVPMNCVFPVKNYHETELRNDLDILLLSALIPVLNSANDHVGEQVNSEGGPQLEVSLDNQRDINFDISRKTQMIEELRNLKISHPNVKHLRLLLFGPVGAGKSALINSIDSIFQGRMSQKALSDIATNTSFTQMFETHKIRDGESGKFLPFAISDVMGLEDEAGGAHVDDINMVLEGHVKDGYRFNPAEPLRKEDLNYHHCPTLNDNVHCLIAVLPADKITMMNHEEDDVLAKMQKIRNKAAALKIPQVVVMTMVDKACTEVNKDLKMIYRSKKIKEKMQECSNKFGVPMNCVFPVKNYHEETEPRNDVNILLLSALIPILNFANDHVGEQVNSQRFPFNIWSFWSHS